MGFNSTPIGKAWASLWVGRPILCSELEESAFATGRSMHIPLAIGPCRGEIGRAAQIAEAAPAFTLHVVAPVAALDHVVTPAQRVRRGRAH